MKKVLLGLSLFFVTNLFSQDELETQELFSDVFTLGLTGRNSREVVEFSLPPNTVRWYFTYAASRNKEKLQKTEKTFNLLSKVSYLVDPSGASAATLSLIGKPPGYDNCDVWVLKSANDKELFSKNSLLEHRKITWEFYPEYSRELEQSGIKAVTNSYALRGTQYIAFRNPSYTNSVSVSVQVVAVVEKTQTTNGWTRQQKDYLYKNLKNQSVFKTQFANLSQENSNDIIACGIGKLTEQYTPIKLKAYAEYELNRIMNKALADCKKELNISTSSNNTNEETRPSNNNNSQQVTENNSTTNNNNQGLTQRPNPLTLEQRTALKNRLDAELTYALQTAGLTNEEQSKAREIMNESGQKSKQISLNSELSVEEKRQNIKQISDDKNLKLRELMGDDKFKSFQQIRKTQREAAMSSRKTGTD